LPEGAEPLTQQAHAVARQTFTTRDENRKSWLIRRPTIGSVNVQLLKDACFPKSPNDKDFDELCTILQQHFNPARDK